MRTNPDIAVKSVAGEVYQIQALLAVSPSHPKWSDVSWSAFGKGERKYQAYEYSKYFVNSEEGKPFKEHPDRPPHYYGERFWTDIPAFMTYDTAKACLDAIISGGWNQGGYKLRIVKYSFIEALETVHVPERIAA